MQLLNFYTNGWPDQAVFTASDAGFIVLMDRRVGIRNEVEGDDWAREREDTVEEVQRYEAA